jgi:hypothetical protein
VARCSARGRASAAATCGSPATAAASAGALPPWNVIIGPSECGGL